MPYTPPSISPSGLHSVSPVKPSSSYAGLANGYPSPSEKQSQPRTTASPHPNYHARPLNHHRRSTGPTSPPRGPIPVSAFAQDRQSPKPPSPIRRASTSSTTDSSDEEDDRETQLNPRHLPNLKELRDAIRILPQHKAPSPPDSPDRQYINKAVLSDNIHAIPDNTRYDSAASDGEQSSSTTPPDNDDDDDGPEFPRMVRKKSGEVVKPSLKSAYFKRRPKSLPSTPIYPKAVHFDAQLEHVRHFLHSEKPLAVSTHTSPTADFNRSDFPFEKDYEKTSEKQYQIELPNFPSGEMAAQRDSPVRVETVYLSSNGRNLIGKVLVKNLAFSKWIAVRFTFDHWQTVSEVSGTYDSAQGNGTTNKDPDWDRFVFSIKLVDFTNLENRHMLFCVRYNVADKEFWDNNYGSNYQVEFRKRPNYLLRRASHPPQANGLNGVGDDSAIGEDFDIELTPETFAKNLAQQISSPRSALLANLGESPPFVKKATLTSSPSPASDLANGTSQKRPTGKAFANRYDFGASLNAAIANANAAIGFEKSGLQKTCSPKPTAQTDSYFAPLPQLFRTSPLVQSPTEAKEDSLVTNIKKSQITGFQLNHHFRSRSYPLGSPAQSPSWALDDSNESNEEGKPPMDSTSYLDFINNYCFFEPGKADAHIPVPLAEHKPTCTSGLLAPPQFPIRATARSPPPSPRKLSPDRTKEGTRPTKSGYIEYTGSSDSNQSSPESSATSTPRSGSPTPMNRLQDHSRDSSSSMRFHHHPSPLGFDTPGAATPTAIVG